jgi:hypothetical protein
MNLPGRRSKAGKGRRHRRNARTGGQRPDFSQCAEAMEFSTFATATTPRINWESNMKHSVKAVGKYLPRLASAAILIIANGVGAAPVVRQGSGANAAALQSIVDTFRADLGGANNGVGGTFQTGRREINWDGVPDASAAPNNMEPDFFNVNSPRGVVFHTVLEDAGSALNDFMVSATTASGTPERFGDINPSYSSTFITNSAQRLFMPRGAHALLVKFYRPGTTVEATVSGFGAVFSDVDGTTGGNRTLISYYAADGRQLVAASAPALSGGLSFIGASFNAGERISHVIIKSGTHALSASNTDGVSGVDVVAMDDFIYGEPQPLSGCLFQDEFECDVP